MCGNVYGDNNSNENLCVTYSGSLEDVSCPRQHMYISWVDEVTSGEPFPHLWAVDMVRCCTQSLCPVTRRCKCLVSVLLPVDSPSFSMEEFYDFWDCAWEIYVLLVVGPATVLVADYSWRIHGWCIYEEDVMTQQELCFLVRPENLCFSWSEVHDL